MYKTCGGEGTELQAIQECLQKCKIACGEDATKPLYAWAVPTFTRLTFIMEKGNPMLDDIKILVKMMGHLISFI